MISSLVLSIDFISKSLLIFHLVSIKLLAIFIIIYKSAHQNNSNYNLFFIVMYIYLEGVKIDVIIFFN